MGIKRFATRSCGWPSAQIPRSSLLSLTSTPSVNSCALSPGSAGSMVPTPLTATYHRCHCALNTNFRAITDSRPVGDAARLPTSAPKTPHTLFILLHNSTRARQQPWLALASCREGTRSPPLWMPHRNGSHRCRAHPSFPTGGNESYSSRRPLLTPRYRETHSTACRPGFASLVAQDVFEEAAGLVIFRPFGYDSEVP